MKSIKGLVLALREIKNFDDESEAEWGDPGQRASSALTNYYNSTK